MCDSNQQTYKTTYLTSGAGGAIDLPLCTMTSHFVQCTMLHCKGQIWENFPKVPIWHTTYQATSSTSRTIDVPLCTMTYTPLYNAMYTAKDEHICDSNFIRFRVVVFVLLLSTCIIHQGCIHEQLAAAAAVFTED